VNADDFGLSPGVTSGILEAYAAGVVSSVSVLVNAPGWEDAVAALRAAGSGLGVGLHVNLTAGEPVSAARSLVDARTGRFPALGTLVARMLAGRIAPADVVEECTAQLDRLRAVGVPVTHIDSHRHVHALPGIWAAVVGVARAYGVRVVRVPLEPLGGDPWRWHALPKRLMIAVAWRLAARGVSPPHHADQFRGLSLQGGKGFQAGLLALLDRLPRGTTELMVHPGHPDAALAAWDGYQAPRATELAVLTSSQVRERFRRGDFQLTHFGTI
jgi:chitin disaccharide deacetylase